MDARDASAHAPPAATRLSATPTKVVPRSPSAGINAKPAITAPAAAPSVLAAYSPPASWAAVDAVRTIQREAIGKVAPMQAAGTHRSNTLVARRTNANVAPPCPSA